MTLRTPIRLEPEDRFLRLTAIDWWNQARLADARLLVVGAGALGNEVIKNLCLVGVGRLVVVDRDRVELSNLSRSILFREADEGRPKAECAARAAQMLYPAIRVQPLVADVLSEVGLGFFRWAEVVVGALDNREARVFVNSACARVERPWFDGAIEALQGVARGFAPPRTACYECTMNQTDWKLLEQRRSCLLLARRALAERGTPTTPTAASIVGGIEAQEVIKWLHGMPSLVGRGFVFDGLGHTSYPVQYQIKPDCPWHEPPPPIEIADDLGSDSTLQQVWERGVAQLGQLDALDLSRDLVDVPACQSCNTGARILAPAAALREDQIACPRCGHPRTATFTHSLTPDSALLSRTVRAIGLPVWDIVWARRGTTCLGIELACDRSVALGDVG